MVKSLLAITLGAFVFSNDVVGGDACFECKKAIEEAKSSYEKSLNSGFKTSSAAANVIFLEGRCRDVCNQQSNQTLHKDNNQKVETIDSTGYSGLGEKQKELYDKIDKHIDVISNQIYAYCVTRLAAMYDERDIGYYIQSNIYACMRSNLNAYSYQQNPKVFKRMMKKLKIKKEDWEYANNLYTSIIINKYTMKY